MSEPIEKEVRAALEELRDTRFADGFEARAVARWSRERVQTPTALTFIERRALRLVPVALAATLLLAFEYGSQWQSLDIVTEFDGRACSGLAAERGG